MPSYMTTEALEKESVALKTWIIHAVNDIAPYPEGEEKDPFMYWDAADETTTALALIKRYVLVIASFVIFVQLFKNFIHRDNNDKPFYKCEGCSLLLHRILFD